MNPNACAVLGLGLLALAAAAAVSAQPPSFDKSFTPSTIGPGSTTELSFDIVNSSPSPVEELEFTDVLPPGVTIATPASAFTDCLSAAGVLDAPDGGTTISLTDGGLGASSSCSARKG